MQASILVIEDNKEIRFSARFVLEDAGFNVVELENPTQAMAYLSQSDSRETNADLILLDMNFSLDTTSGEEGLQFLRWLQQQGSKVPLVAMTAWSNTALVVQAMQLGAGDFIEKPWHNQRLLQVIRQQLKLAQLQQHNKQLSAAFADPASPLLAHSEAMQRLLQQLTEVARSDANILLTGENGSGKTQLAQFIHNKSQRASAAFISVNMGAIVDSLFESEMFGHKKGAFTDAKEARVGRFALAQGGSLFLDEIATLPLNQQAKLLRVLESGQYEVVGSSLTEQANVRLISASNADFAALLAAGQFRQDLYYRLNTLQFTVPALRQRPDDIIPLCRYFLQQHGSRYQKHGLQLTATAETALRQYAWPGNVRELSHAIERAVLLCQSGKIDSSDLALALPAAINTANGQPAPIALEQMTLEQAELQLIRQALAQFPANKQRAAEQLGITKSSLYRRLEKYGLDK
ncbi:sigma-54 dependent transcriptional regulator [Rheinheimera muenzenbergensis]|uniref:Sigma-54 dependent transcriptional regulator n=1 Tax=Rheinheimera muenzenbergensis TaxID=1193628 RepID=A0ABU8C5I4_9GAMM